MARSAKNLAQIPHRASAPDTGFSVDELSAELQNLEQDGGKDVRSEILTLLKTRLMTAKDFAKQRFERGRLDGLETARALAAVHDNIVIALWNYTTQNRVAAEALNQKNNISLCVLTSLLDVRHLAGDEALSDRLYTQFRKNITRGKGRAYIAAKLAERDGRHAREGNSRYVIEPNIKEGKGGLRDLHVLYWITRFLDRDGTITDPQRAADYTTLGLFDKRAAQRFLRAADFLWRTRHHLHWTAGRPTEQLSFDMQVRLAPKMGHDVDEVEVGVERFMREYFTNAREVGALTRIACAKLEAG